MREIDKAAMGGRIREIRSHSGLRQWELARLLGTTQSAIHKYERGVMPEPRRLMELARVGNTSIEWILTGRHGQDGTTHRERPPDALLRTASTLNALDGEERARVEEAVRLLRAAESALSRTSDSSAPRRPETLAEELGEHAGEARRLLESAWRVQRAVLRRVVRDVEGRFEAFAAEAGPESEDRS